MVDWSDLQNYIDIILMHASPLGLCWGCAALSECSV